MICVHLCFLFAIFRCFTFFEFRHPDVRSKDKKPIVEAPMAYQEYLAVPLAEFCSGPNGILSLKGAQKNSASW